ncbi:MAG: hypothetical protein J5817_06290 [Treponema sp.]|nr:hypothetical protein [Treponema sp.]
MKKKYCIFVLLFVLVFTNCMSAKPSAEYDCILIAPPSAVIHIRDNSSDSDFKLSKVDNIKIENIKAGDDAIKVPALKTLTLHFKKSITSSETSTKGKTSSVEITDNTYSWTVESPKTTVTERTEIQEISYDCPCLKEGQEYSLTISAEGFILKENGNLTMIAEGKFQK